MSCDVFIYKEEATQESVTMAIHQLAHIVMDAHSINSSVDQMRAYLNTTSVVLSNIASFIQNQPAIAMLDSTVRG